jgi:hypothetical protein
VTGACRGLKEWLVVLINKYTKLAKHIEVVRDYVVQRRILLCL